jgi:hypothetical protein
MTEARLPSGGGGSSTDIEVTTDEEDRGP